MAGAGFAIAHGSIPGEPQLGDKGGEGCIVARRAKVGDEPDKSSAEDIKHMVKGGVRRRFDDSVVLEAVLAVLEGDDDRTVDHDGKQEING